jgi:hypothetical protein
MMNDISGHTSKKQLAHLDQESSSWKTCEGISASASKKFLQTLPKSGMTQDGKLYELATLARPIKGHDSSLLLTPTASIGEFHHRTSLLPTPLTTDGHMGTPADLKRDSPGLRAMDVLPTPTAMHVRNHDEPLYAYAQRVKDYEIGKTKGKPGMSTGLALRWIDRTFRIHWIKVN